jgi:hypothetical protein
MTLFHILYSKATAFLLLLGAPAVLCGQFRGPCGGLLYHRASRSVRAIIGVPGSAYLGAPILSAVDFAAVSPDGKWLLMSRGERQAAITGFDRPERVEHPLEDLVPGVDMAAWNASGGAVAVYSSAFQKVQKVRISVQPGAGPATDVSGLGGKVAALALDREGQSIALLVEGSSNPGLYLLPGGAEPVFLAAMARPNGIAFAPDRDLLAVVDRETREIHLFNDRVFSGAIPLSIEGEDWDYHSPVAISQNGRELYTVAGVEPTLLVYDLQSRELVSRHRLEAPPDLLSALPLMDSYVLNAADKPGEPVVIYQRGSRSGVYFIPAGEISPATP